MDGRTVELIFIIVWIVLSYPAYCWIRGERIP